MLTGEVRIYNAEGHLLGPGAIGDIYVRMHGTPDFTYHGDQAKRDAMERDGFITVGDIGWLDSEGHLYFCDRRADVVISWGVNIYPAEIEAALLSHNAIADTPVFGIPDEEFGESLCAHIATALPVTEGEIRSFLKGLISSHKIPK